VDGQGRLHHEVRSPYDLLAGVSLEESLGDGGSDEETKDKDFEQNEVELEPQAHGFLLTCTPRAVCAPG